MAEKKKSKFSIITNGLLEENPVLRLVLGTCPTLAISVAAKASLGMGLAATFVLICSNAAISALRKVIPDKVRIPAYITVIASFVTALEMLIEAFMPTLYSALGIYLPLIVVNCIILGRAEMFASKNPVLDSALDGLGMGLGFTAVLLVMGSLRELLGTGCVFGYRLIPEAYSIGIVVTSSGGFFTYGCLIALLTALLAKKGRKLDAAKDGCSGCAGCAGCDACGEAKK
ncbi:MAG: electron transport complex subunit E [Oscillospiraceae bacterium]|nr:electron transport complex subunit E [Oscillospiraceae bacterium]